MKITEEQLKNIIAECLNEALQDEKIVDESLLNNLKDAAKGAYNSFKASRSLDNTSDNKRNDYDKMDPYTHLFGPNSNRKDAAAEASELYQLGRKYQSMASKLFNRARALTKYANLNKTGKGENTKFNYTQSHNYPIETVSGLHNRGIKSHNDYDLY